MLQHDEPMANVDSRAFFEKVRQIEDDLQAFEVRRAPVARGIRIESLHGNCLAVGKAHNRNATAHLIQMGKKAGVPGGYCLGR